MTQGKVLHEPLNAHDATRLIHTIAREGDVGWSHHGREQMQARTMTAGDCLNVMRSGVVTEPADLISGTWRYRIHTQRMSVVVAFRTDTELTVVTAWRNRR